MLHRGSVALCGKYRDINSEHCTVDGVTRPTQNVSRRQNGSLHAQINRVRTTEGLIGRYQTSAPFSGAIFRFLKPGKFSNVSYTIYNCSGFILLIVEFVTATRNGCLKTEAGHSRKTTEPTRKCYRCRGLSGSHSLFVTVVLLLHSPPAVLVPPPLYFPC